MEVGDGLGRGDTEEEVQVTSHLWHAEVGGWWHPAVRWDPLGMTGSGQGMEESDIVSHSTLHLFSAIAPCAVLELSLIKCYSPAFWFFNSSMAAWML